MLGLGFVVWSWIGLGIVGSFCFFRVSVIVVVGFLLGGVHKSGGVLLRDC